MLRYYEEPGGWGLIVGLGDRKKEEAKKATFLYK